MKELTSGFDLVAQLSEDVCEYIFRMAYWSDLPTGLPDFAALTDAQNPKDQVEVYFKVPSLEFTKVGELNNTVRITCPFTARVFPETIEITANIAVIMVAVLRQNEANVIVVDFVDTPEQFGIANAFPKDLPIIESRVKPLIVRTLFQRLKGRPISPPVTPNIPFFTFQTYISATSRRNGNSSTRLLGVFINRQNLTAPAPSIVDAWVQNDQYRPLKPQGGIDANY
jgi:hypothetical protein